MTVPIASAKFVDSVGFFTEATHTQERKCWQSALATVSTMHYSATVQLFAVDKPHQRFLAVVDVARITTSRNQSYGVRYQKKFAQYFIACGRDCYGLMKDIYITILQKVVSEHLASLSQHSDIILTVGFQYSLLSSSTDCYCDTTRETQNSLQRSFRQYHNRTRRESSQHISGSPLC